MDHEPGSIDAQILERADDNDSLQILDLMKKTIMLHPVVDTSEVFVDQDAELIRRVLFSSPRRRSEQ